MPELGSFIGYGMWVAIALAVVAVIFIGSRFWRNIPQGHIGLVERRLLGRKPKTGRVFSTGGEIGIEADYLKPGPRLLFFPVRRLVDTITFTDIDANQVGIVTATDGEPLPQGRIYAEDKAGEFHNDFQDPVAFLTKGGIRGKQLRLVNTGRHMINTKLFQVQAVDKTIIPDGKIGIVTALDGSPLEPGQIVGRRVEGHDKFQKAEEFIKNGGQKGPQVDFVPPGTWNINTAVFKVEIADAITVKDDEVGLVTALVGAPLGQDEVVAKTPDPDKHHTFQDGEKFLDMGGQRGVQEALLPPGTYYLNRFMFQVTKDKATFIPQGSVGVVISYIGKDPAAPTDTAAPAPLSTTLKESTALTLVGEPSTDPEDKRLDANVRMRHVVPRGFKGIQDTVLGPNKYYLNVRALKVIPVATTTATLEWAQGTTKNGFDPFKVTSKDGYSMEIEVQCNYRVAPENAAFVISKVGEIELLEKNVIHPLVDGIFRNHVAGSPAIAYMQQRGIEQDAALAALRKALSEYKVEAVQLLITNIVMDETLVNTVKRQNMAQLQTQAYEAEQLAEVKRIELEKTKAQANQQQRLMEAQIGISVADNQAQQAIKVAEGKAKAIKIEAEADAERTTKTGLAKAEVIEAQGRATGVAFHEQAKALGSSGLALVQALGKIAEGNIRITPNFLVSGGNGEGGTGGNGTLGSALLALVTAGLAEKAGLTNLDIDPDTTDATATAGVGAAAANTTDTAAA
jgi:hypothetical protein